MAVQIVANDAALASRDSTLSVTVRSMVPGVRAVPASDGEDCAAAIPGSIRHPRTSPQTPLLCASTDRVAPKKRAWCFSPVVDIGAADVRLMLCTVIVCSVLSPEESTGRSPGVSLNALLCLTSGTLSVCKLLDGHGQALELLDLDGETLLDARRKPCVIRQSCQRRGRPAIFHSDPDCSATGITGISTITIPVSATRSAPISAMASWSSILCSASTGRGI